MMGITNYQKTASEKQIAYDNELDKKLQAAKFAKKIKALADQTQMYIAGTDYEFDEIQSLFSEIIDLCTGIGDENILGDTGPTHPDEADKAAAHQSAAAAKVGAEIDGFIKDMFFTSTR
jgi:hypothetical protein